MIKYILFIKPLRYLYICIKKASMKLPASLRHDNDRLTVRNLACTVEYVSLIFTGSNGDNMALPSRLLCGEPYECLVFRIAASRQVEAPRDASSFFHHFNACHSSILSNELQQQSLLLLRERTLLPKNPAGYLM